MSASRRTTIVLDPLIHKEAKRLAREANLNLKEFMGHLITQGVKATALALSGLAQDKIKEEIKKSLIEYLETL